MELDAEMLLSLVEKSPAIYDYTSKDHHNRDFIEKLWEEIAKEMNAKVGDCKTKWTTLRNSYSRYLRELKKMPSGSGKSKRKKWYLADAMSFLSNFMGQHKKMESNIQVDNLSENGEENENLNINEASGSSEIAKDIETELNVSCKGLKNKKVLEMVAEPMIKFLNSKSDKNENPNLNFFKSLLPDMDTLTPKRQRNFKQKVMATLHQLLEEQENEAIYLSGPSNINNCTNDLYHIETYSAAEFPPN